MSDQDRYPEEHEGAKEVWERDGATFTILHISRTYTDHYCGYVRFPKRPLATKGYGGLARYVPVHGGLTYAEEDNDGSMVYGFDCAHAYDENNPLRRDMDWLRTECQRMAQAISIAAAYEEEYEQAEGKGRAAVIDAYLARLHEEHIDFDLGDNFGAMIAVLTGKL